MEAEHIKAQYDRLDRHYNSSLNEKDPISFLDLSHALRVWVDMKSSVDGLARTKDITFEFENPVKNKSIDKMLRGSMIV